MSQHDDSYIILHKMRHLLVGHYVRNDVQSLNVALCIKMQVQKFYLHYNTKMIIIFSITFRTT
jgi:hypothetical protein